MDGELKRPVGIAISKFGEIAIVDSGNHRVQLFTGKGEHVGKFGTEGAAEGQFQGNYSILCYIILLTKLNPCCGKRDSKDAVKHDRSI